jgi:hypothetical protein
MPVARALMSLCAGANMCRDAGAGAGCGCAQFCDQRLRAQLGAEAGEAGVPHGRVGSEAGRLHDSAREAQARAADRRPERTPRCAWRPVPARRRWQRPLTPACMCACARGWGCRQVAYGVRDIHNLYARPGFPEAQEALPHGEQYVGLKSLASQAGCTAVERDSFRDVILGGGGGGDGDDGGAAAAAAAATSRRRVDGVRRSPCGRHDRQRPLARDPLFPSPPCEPRWSSCAGSRAAQ